MSKEMNLHGPSLDYMTQNREKFQNLSNMRQYLASQKQHGMT